MAMIIIDRIMQNTAIIPQRKIANLPNMPASELFGNLVMMQIAKQGSTFCLAPPLKIAAMARADIQALARCLGMGADDRMATP